MSIYHSSRLEGVSDFLYYWIWRIGHVHVSLEDFRPGDDPASCDDGGDDSPCDRANKLMLIDESLFCPSLDVRQDLGM